VNGMGHLVGGTEIGAIANAFGIGIAIGLNAGTGILMILLVMVLTPLVKRHGVGAADPRAHSEERASLTPEPEPDD
ncbi:MAG: hypothetical protein VYC83_02370, partial [Chloroflexota bacterium]|nr:hypothetical protein [Chloroflexota bacterium]